MEAPVVFLFILVVVAAVGAIVWLALAKRRGQGDAMLMLQRQNEALREEIGSTLTKNMAVVNEQLGRITTQVSEQLSKVTTQMQSSTGQFNERMDNAARVVGEVKHGLGELSKATEQVFSVGKDIAGLQQILTSPKLRGEFGEFLLGDLLGQMLPAANYELEYTFRSGVRVDAVIKLGNGLVPVDAKFSLENFTRIMKSTSDEERRANRKKFISDVKKRINEIAGKYILPDEGTLNFALMYIPAENVYYETIIRDEGGEENTLAAYAFSKKVVPVSPNSFYAYLQTILQGLKGLEISRKAEQILSHLERLRGDFDRFSGEFDILGKHIYNARTKYEEVQKRIERFSDRFENFSDVGQASLAEGTPGDEGKEPGKGTDVPDVVSIKKTKGAGSGAV